MKCDAVRPTCGICKLSEAVCKYTDPLPEKYGRLISENAILRRMLTRLARLQVDVSQPYIARVPSNSSRIDSATELLSNKLDRLQQDIDKIYGNSRRGRIPG